jgi:hypothetical protein
VAVFLFCAERAGTQIGESCLYHSKVTRSNSFPLLIYVDTRAHLPENAATPEQIPTSFLENN